MNTRDVGNHDLCLPVDRRTRRRWRALLALVLIIGLSFSAEKLQSAKAGEPLQEWEVIGKSGMCRFVYVSSDGLKDKFFVAQVLWAIVSKESHKLPIQIMLFNERRFTPRAFPMTDAQLLHWKARYNKNPNTNLEEFVWISVTNANASPPDLKETPSNIRPGFAE